MMGGWFSGLYSVESVIIRKIFLPTPHKSL